MACTVDHLCRDARVRVLQDFRDACGVLHRVGETAVIRSIELNWVSLDLTIEWERNGKKETLLFSSKVTTGPGNGRMREYFEVEGMEPLLPPAPKPPARLLVPPIPRKTKSDEERYATGFARIEALISNHRFDEADAEIRGLLDRPDAYGARLPGLGEDLVGIAMAYKLDPVAFAWVREKALDLWYSWGANASSGGEGAARLLEIDRARERMDRAAQSAR